MRVFVILIRDTLIIDTLIFAMIVLQLRIWNIRGVRGVTVLSRMMLRTV